MHADLTNFINIAQWTCSIASISGYGSHCGVFGTADTATSVIEILPNMMSLDTTYAFVVVVISLDGRRDSKTVLVTPVFAGSAQLSITSPFTRFNAGSKLVVNGYISADYAVTTEWSVLTSSGLSAPFKALTSKVKSFSAADAASQISFPLSIDAGAFAGGSTYIFKLSAHPSGNLKLTTFAEIILTANSPPTGGYVLPTPIRGNALVTKFLISAPGWTADASNFPLSYSFAYTLSPASSYLTLAASSLRAFTTSTLPAGLYDEEDLVTVEGRAIDIFMSFGVATATVAVTLSPTTNVSHILSTGLASAFVSGDINLAFQTVNNVRCDL